MDGFRTFMLPQNVVMNNISMSKKVQQLNSQKSRVMATSAAHTNYDLNYYVKAALAGGICCSITHGALCPVDVVKTRIQLDPIKYNRGLIGGISQVVAEEGMMGLATGLGPTVVGYFIQGISYLLFVFEIYLKCYLSCSLLFVLFCRMV
jgi:hypothetical protein